MFEQNMIIGCTKRLISFIHITQSVHFHFGAKDKADVSMFELKDKADVSLFELKDKADVSMFESKDKADVSMFNQKTRRMFPYLN